MNFVVPHFEKSKREAVEQPLWTWRSHPALCWTLLNNKARLQPGCHNSIQTSNWVSKVNLNSRYEQVKGVTVMSPPYFTTHWAQQNNNAAHVLWSRLDQVLHPRICCSLASELSPPMRISIVAVKPRLSGILFEFLDSTNTWGQVHKESELGCVRHLASSSAQKCLCAEKASLERTNPASGETWDMQTQNHNDIPAAKSVNSLAPVMLQHLLGSYKKKA